MELSAFSHHLQVDGARLAVAARSAGLGAAVPMCPGWTVEDLVVHTAKVFRHQTHVLTTGATQRPRGAEWNRNAPPREQLVDWYDEELVAVVRALERTDPARRVWTWWPADQTAGFWSRRMAHEAAVHRIDAEAAGGMVTPIDTALALDGIDEVLDLYLAPRIGPALLEGPPATVHLHATDGAGEWLLHLGEHGLAVERGHAKGDAAARGTASDLLLWLWGRVPLADLEVFGDESPLVRLRAAAAAVTVSRAVT